MPPKSNLPILRVLAALCLLSTTPAIFGADAPTAGAPAARKGGPPGLPITAAEQAEIGKLNDLPAWKTGDGDGNYSVGPTYAPAPEQSAREGVPHGKVVTFTMDSAGSKFYPGADGAFKRAVSVYVPAQYVPGKPAAVIVSCDAYGAKNNQLPNILDNLIADQRLPVIVAVMIANGGTERSMEYDTVSPKYAEFVEAEVLPRAEQEAGVVITKDPDGRMTLGGSSGGVAAFTMAWFHPELYHRVLSYSGTFVALKRDDHAPHGAWEYHENFIPKSPAKPLRVWLHVSENDNGAATAGATYRNWVIANQHMAAVLQAKGYHYQLVYAKAAGHTDGKVIAQTYPQALEWVWQGYQPVTN
jgi:enterochelin esterase family protein